jgi:hypothetical protein
MFSVSIFFLLFQFVIKRKQQINPDRPKKTVEKYGNGYPSSGKPMP